ncbi:hypothetical protein [Citricoccus sp. CH26A]|uniref:hypothetical protein n=1 Tax=Citricoccus TaxID=169133 RepID=UPI0002FB1442|nr:hypothetical protein [Citricoccus sp. CH26A]
MTNAAYHFLPWVRTGLAASIKQHDTLNSGLPSRPSAPITVRLTSTGPENVAATDDVTMPLRLYGPGDVTGIDSRVIVRTEPTHHTPDFPPHLLATIEFDRPDFPWLLTPAAPSGDRLRPWLVLVVVSQTTSRITHNHSRPLPELQCPRNELPNLAESWLWAHAQFVGPADTTNVVESMTTHPHQTISRLICPRRLEPDHSPGYLACLVPAFAVGRKAGLGEPISAEDETRLEPAWDTSPTDGEVTLPVYFSWEFGTAVTEEDFEELVDRLQMVGADDAPQPARMDVGDAGRGMPQVPGATLGLPSILLPKTEKVPQWPDGLAVTEAQYREALEQQLRVPNGQDNRVALPRYGQMHAVGNATDPGQGVNQAVPAWVRELNLDPRYRVAAAIGARVVRENQEHLVGAAWRQAGQVAEANQWQARKQLGQEVTRSIYEKRLKNLTPSTFQQITAPIVAPPTDQVRRTLTPPAPLVDAIVSSPFRRLARSEGPLARHTAISTTMQVTASPLGPTLGPLLSALTAMPTALTAQLFTAAKPEDVRALWPSPTSPTGSRDGRLADSARAEMLSQLNPETTYPVEARARIKTTRMSHRSESDFDPLTPLDVTPIFTQPMYEPLRDVFSDLLLPGLDAVPNNSVLLLDTNPAVLEAYMAGLNDEMNRELLWREFPTDLRGTYFRQFWDVRAQGHDQTTEAGREARADLPPVSEWKDRLGKHLKPDRGKDLVALLIKGDVLTRFPTAVVFAAPARWSRSVDGTTPVAPAVIDEDQKPLFPSLIVDISPGVRLVGFNIEGGSAVAVGGEAPPEKPGWFIVMQEHPFEPRFGLNSSRNDATDPLTTWRKLAWTDIGLRAGTPYIDPSIVPELKGNVRVPDTAATWGRSGADMAYITLQKAYRLEVHAGNWLP